LGGSWAQIVADNAEMAQSLVWLPIHMGNVGLTLLVDGLPNKLIAGALGITEGTVKQHLKSLYKRLNVQNRTQAVRTARSMGLLEE